MAIIYSNTIYALLVLIGGVIGFVKSGSTASIVMGSIFGLLLLLSSFLIHKKLVWGLYLSILLTAFLALFFGYRFMNSYKFMPAGLMCILSAVNLVFVYLNRPDE